MSRLVLGIESLTDYGCGCEGVGVGVESAVGPITFNTGLIVGGTASNVVPGKCTATVHVAHGVVNVESGKWKGT